MRGDLSALGTVDLAALRLQASIRCAEAYDALTEAEKEHRIAALAVQDIDDALDLTIACPSCRKPTGESCWRWGNPSRDGHPQVHHARRLAAREQAADDLGRMP